MRTYLCPFEISGATAAIDLVEVTPADEKSCCFSSIIIKVTSELQEAQEEWVEVNILRGGTAMTTGSGGSGSAAGHNANPLDEASGFVFEAGNTTVATFTGGTTPYVDAFNVRAGGEIRLTPEEYIWFNQINGGAVVRLPNAAGDAIDVKGTVFVLEAP